MSSAGGKGQRECFAGFSLKQRTYIHVRSLCDIALIQRRFENSFEHSRAPSNVAEVLSVYIRLTAFTEDSRAYLLVSYHIAFPQSSYRGNLSHLGSKPVLPYGNKLHYVGACCLILFHGDITCLNIIDSLHVLTNYPQPSSSVTFAWNIVNSNPPIKSSL